VLRQVHIPSLHRIVVDVVEFLAHHRFAVDHFRVRAFLPQLIHPILLVRPFAEAQSLQSSMRTFASQVVDDLPCGKGFELAQGLAQVRCLGNEVKVVFEDHVTEQLLTVVGLLVTPAVQQVVDDEGADEQREPFHERTGEEVGFVRLGDGVTASAHGIRP